MSSTARRRIAIAAALLALGLVFAWYLQPELLVSLATQLWACF